MISRTLLINWLTLAHILSKRKQTRVEVRIGVSEPTQDTGCSQSCAAVTPSVRFGMWMLPT